MDEEAAPETDPATDPVGALQQTISRIEPDAMCIGFVCLIEWLEPDGSTTMSMLHTPMPPWHMTGMLHHAQDFSQPIMGFLDCDHEDEEEDEEY